MKFQYIFLTVFGIMAVVAVIIFANAPSRGDQSGGAGIRTVSIWGTFPEDFGLSKMIGDFNTDHKGTLSISYVFHDPKNFDRDIVEALASGKGPDMLLLPDDLLMRHTDKIELIPYASVGQDVFKGLFIQAAEIYLRDQGIVALPFAIDPMVMYWNRDIFNNASITQPPLYWDEFLVVTPKLTRFDKKTSVITQSTIAFGEYVNVDNAKDIIAMLFLQVGNPIIKLENGRPMSDLVVTNGNQIVLNQDVASAFRFYMDFSNPLKSNYSWGRARASSRDEFINGNLAVYFGFASEYRPLQEKNPHLNFAVAPIPLPRGTKVEVTVANMHGLAVMKSSTNKTASFMAAQQLLDQKPSGKFATIFNLPPVRRDLLGRRPTDAVLSVFYDSAIRARTWLDPRPEDSDRAFREAVESVSSGRSTIPAAVNNLSAQLTAAFPF
jgi:ABC-type glycerol-3-phosphate transport system substrate-binding protein